MVAYTSEEIAKTKKIFVRNGTSSKKIPIRKKIHISSDFIGLKTACVVSNRMKENYLKNKYEWRKNGQFILNY